MNCSRTRFAVSVSALFYLLGGTDSGWGQNSSTHDKAAFVATVVLGEQDVHVVEGFDVTRDYMLSGMLSHYRIIHFATHGVIDARHPEMSRLVLSLINAKGKKQDGCNTS